MNLFIKITDDINKKNVIEAQKVEQIFKPKKPIVTTILIVINVLIFMLGLGFNISDKLIMAFGNYKPLILNGEYYRLITSMFLHDGIFHIGFNMYVLYVIGSQAEGFFGKAKFSIIYLLSGITGSLLSMLLNFDTVSIGASGAIFGILGALLYFGYNFRVYLGNTLIREILPIIAINLFLGFADTNIDNYGHIGGLVGGYVSAMALGFTTRSNKTDKINGIVITIMLLAFLVFMNFFYAG